MSEFHCSRCILDFSNKSNLLRHQKSCCNSNRPHLCSCGKTFKRPDHLKRHKKTCNPNLIKSDKDGFLCHICGMLFVQKSHIARHLKTCITSEKIVEVEENNNDLDSVQPSNNDNNLDGQPAKRNDSYNFGLDANGNGNISPSILDYLEEDW